MPRTRRRCIYFPAQIHNRPVPAGTTGRERLCGSRNTALADAAHGSPRVCHPEPVSPEKRLQVFHVHRVSLQVAPLRAAAAARSCRGNAKDRHGPRDLAAEKPRASEHSLLLRGRACDTHSVPGPNRSRACSVTLAKCETDTCL